MRLFLIAFALGHGFLTCSADEEKPWLDPQKWISEEGSGHDFSKLQDGVIRKKLNEIAADPDALSYKRREEFEGLLNEVSSRKAGVWSEYLRGLLKQVREGPEGDKEENFFLDRKDVEVLAVLRKLEGKPHPLRIGIKKLQAEKWEFPRLPVIEMSASRTPGEKEDFMFTFGGNYRTGRLARWTVLAWDEKGHQVKRKLSSPSGFGGGIFSKNKIGGELWQSSLSLVPYLETPLMPGKYHACLAYHNEETIAGIEDLKNYVLAFSGAFSFEVTPMEIPPLDIKTEEVGKLVRSLPREGRVKVLSGTYGEGYHDFIAPQSAAGRLLEKGWVLLPSLLELAGDEELNEIQRAWLFGVMHSITGQMDPTGYKHVVGNYRKKSGGFWISSKVNGRFAGGGGGLGGSESSSGGEVKLEAQKKLIGLWKERLPKMIVVKKKEE